MDTQFQPIRGSASDGGRDDEPGVIRLNQSQTEELEALFMGRTVTKVDGEHLVLDNGTVIKAIGHDGGCACSAGCYDLSVLNGTDNIITRVEFDYRPAGDYEDPVFEPGDPDAPEDRWDGYYRIFVFVGDQRINLMQFDGSDGNGYYGTGFEILVRKEGE